MCFPQSKCQRSTCLCSELWPLQASSFPAGWGRHRETLPGLPQTAGGPWSHAGSGEPHQVLSCRNSGRPLHPHRLQREAWKAGARGAHPNSQPDGLLQAWLFQRCVLLASNAAGCGLCLPPIFSLRHRPPRVPVAHGAEPHLHKCQRLFNSQQHLWATARLLGHSVHGKCDEAAVPGCPGGQLPHHLPTPSPLFSSSKHTLNKRIAITVHQHSMPSGRGAH